MCSLAQKARFSAEISWSVVKMPMIMNKHSCQDDDVIPSSLHCALIIHTSLLGPALRKLTDFAFKNKNSDGSHVSQLRGSLDAGV